MEVSLFKNERTTCERLEKFVSKHDFLDCNLKGVLYSEHHAFTEILHFDFAQKRVKFPDVIAALENETGTAIRAGFRFGPTWSTHWFKVTCDLPEAWVGRRVHLRWDTEGEGMVYSESGEPRIGLAAGDYDKTDFCVSTSLLRENLHQTLFVECAANGCFGAGHGGMIQPPDPEKVFTVKLAEMAVFNEQAYGLLMDLDIVIGMAKYLPEADHRRYRALYAGNQAVNLCDPTDTDSIERARRSLKNSVFKAGHSTGFEIAAVGNSHIDTAWLWPYAETRRKVARSWATALALIDQYPDLIFAVSQAQQVAWLREDYPGLYSRVAAAAGRLVGVGGVWTEPDGNLPGGESFLRQLLYGQREFERALGRPCTEFWLPDTFGYSAQLPQIMRHAGISRFVTQKLSWNLVNKFPHHTFWWSGIDGSKVLTHFPPGDTYGMEVTVGDCIKTTNNFKDKGRSSRALMLYGFGDGGGGPSSDMLERLQRLRNLDGMPNVVPKTPSEFFEDLESSGESNNLCIWEGELYLELHNGTYTTQAKMKKYNRQCEFLLKDCELLSVLQWLQSKGQIVRHWSEEWKKVLLNQFHDVLPGSSIEMVYEDAHALYQEVFDSCHSFLKSTQTSSDTYLLNSLSWDRIVQVEDSLYYLPALSVSDKNTARYETDETVAVYKNDQTNGYIVMENKHLKATIDDVGRVVSLRMVGQGLTDSEERLFDAIHDKANALGNTFVLYDDVPLYWDAWDVMDYHLETGKELDHVLTPPIIVKSGPLVGSVEFELTVGKASKLKQIISLSAGKPYLEFQTYVEWHESHKFLKVQFPLNVHSEKATYEIQFGHLSRPTHRNTSWDAAKFEVCGHKWADVSEHNFGVALLNNCKYGHSCFGNTLSLSLLRSPKAPDANCDMDLHSFTYALMPHLGSFQQPSNCVVGVIQAAYELNTTVGLVSSNVVDKCNGLIKLSHPAVIVESMKIAENCEGVIVRLYESFGSKCLVKLQLDALIDIKEAWMCDGLEVKMRPLICERGNEVSLVFTPFEIKTVMLKV